MYDSMCLCVGLHICVHVCVCMWRPEVDKVYLSNLSPPCIVSQGSSLKLELTHFSAQTSHEAPESLLSTLPQSWNYRHALLLKTVASEESSPGPCRVSTLLNEHPVLSPTMFTTKGFSTHAPSCVRITTANTRALYNT